MKLRAGGGATLFPVFGTAEMFERKKVETGTFDWRHNKLLISDRCKIKCKFLLCLCLQAPLRCWHRWLVPRTVSIRDSCDCGRCTPTTMQPCFRKQILIINYQFYFLNYIFMLNLFFVPDISYRCGLPTRRRTCEGCGRWSWSQLWC